MNSYSFCVVILRKFYLKSQTLPNGFVICVGSPDSDLQRSHIAVQHKVSIFLHDSGDLSVWRRNALASFYETDGTLRYIALALATLGDEGRSEDLHLCQCQVVLSLDNLDDSARFSTAVDGVYTLTRSPVHCSTKMLVQVDLNILKYYTLYLKLFYWP